jgi:CHAT domain-containing protein
LLAQQTLESGQQLDVDQSESFLAIALEHWALQPQESARHKSILTTLSEDLVIFHRDAWLRDFEVAHQSQVGDGFLSEAIRLNHAGDADHAIKAASEAEKAFVRERNMPGAFRSSFEQVYGLRRSSRSSECLKKGSALLSALRNENYPWIQAQNYIELSSCEFMANNFDHRAALAEKAVSLTEHARYRNLHLRALALRANLNMQEGRAEGIWSIDNAGLQTFWKGTFPQERAFQFYHDLQFQSELGHLDHLALLLQRETLSMIAGQGRYDFEAMAHFQLAEAAGSLNDTSEMEKELGAYRSLIDLIPERSAARKLYEAFCDVGLARLALKSGEMSQSASYLLKARPWVAQADNLSLRLEYLRTQADYDRSSSDVIAEKEHLKSLSSLVLREYQHTSSASDRWHMRQALDSARRRLLEIQLGEPHTPLQTFAEWHWWASVENALSLPHILESSPEAWAQKQLRFPDSGVLISFVVLPHSVVAWTASNRGTHEYILPMDVSDLRRRTHFFHMLCSDQTSQLQKVKASGSRLYKLLIAPLEQDIDPKETIWISADSVLNWIPWDALRTNRGRYWGLTHPLVIRSDIAKSRWASGHNIRMKHILVANPAAVSTNSKELLPLPHATEESNFISNIFDGTYQLRPGEVTSARLLHELHRSDGFHFAGHAITGMNGGELLIDGNSTDHFLTTAELGKQRLAQLHLVVLAACSTAPGDNDTDRNPDGLINLFSSAGVPAVIASRWDVDSSSTSALMKIFYRELKRTHDASASLRTAKRTLSSNQQFEHPYYWSAFQNFD